MKNKLIIQNSTPESVGISSESINALLSSLTEKKIKMHSLLIMKDDQLVFEKYWSPYNSTKPHRMFSISKTYTAIAIGMLEEEGKLSIDDKVAKYFPEFISDSTHQYILDITIRDMLMMRTCHRVNTYNKFDPSSNWARSFFITEPSHPSGLMFSYDTAGVHVLCALVEKLSGMAIMDYLRSKLQVLDLCPDSYFIKDGLGVSIGGSGLMCPPMDLIKMAYMILHKGQVNGESLISSSYIEEMTTFKSCTKGTRMASFERAGYGMQIWMHEENGFCSYGMAGQLILFYPDINMAIVTTADGIGMDGSVQLIQDSINKEFVRTLRKTLGITSNSTTSNIQSLLDPVSSVYPEPSDYTDDVTHTLSFPLKGQNISITFGLGRLVEGKIPFYDMTYTASGSIWSEDKVGKHLYIRLDIVDESIGNIHFDVVLLSKEKAIALSHGKNDKGLFVSMNKYEESMFSEFTGQHLFLGDEWQLDI